MEEKTINEEIEKNNSMLLKAKTGQDVEPEKYETPLDEARRLNRETKENMEKMAKLSKELQTQMNMLAISGKSYAGYKEEKPKDPIEEIREKGRQAALAYLGGK